MIRFTQEAWGQYLYWQQYDKKILKKINQLIKECLRHPYEGTGKPEPLKGDLAGCWSRRISGADRLVYRVDDETLSILACRFHYDD
ncbi:MAG: Txe/YoeB family addiction module toxin [bacterium]|nr:Txe/YoeB family addiction module toxin [bacterium]